MVRNDPTVSVVRRFDMKTGTPLGDIVVQGASWFNDIEVAQDGTIYGTIPGANQVWRVLPNGQASIFVEAENVPSAASMCYGSGARQLVIRMNANNAVALLSIEQ